LIYGSSFRNVIVIPRLSNKCPMAADDSPFPRDETTPPVMKINLLIVRTFDGIGKNECI
jgi:hypothetical protein